MVKSITYLFLLLSALLVIFSFSADFEILSKCFEFLITVIPGWSGNWCSTSRPLSSEESAEIWLAFTLYSIQFWFSIFLSLLANFLLTAFNWLLLWVLDFELILLRGLLSIIWMCVDVKNVFRVGIEEFICLFKLFGSRVILDASLSTLQFLFCDIDSLKSSKYPVCFVLSILLVLYLCI